jgi:hypothetical protein
MRPWTTMPTMTQGGTQGGSTPWWCVCFDAHMPALVPKHLPMIACVRPHRQAAGEELEVDGLPGEADHGSAAGLLSGMTYAGWSRAQVLLDRLYPPRRDFPSRPCTNLPRPGPDHAQALTKDEAVVAKSILRLNVEEGQNFFIVYTINTDPRLHKYIMCT